MGLLEARLHHVGIQVGLGKVVAQSVHLGVSAGIFRRVGVVFIEQLEPCVYVLARAIVYTALVLVGLYGLQRSGLARDVGSAAEREVVGVIDVESRFLALLGSYEDYAECGARSVYCRRCSILEHRNRLDVVGVEHVDVHLDIVDEHERTARVDTVDTTHVERHALTGHSRRTSDLQSGHSALQCLVDCRQRTVAKHVVHLHTAYGSGKVCLLLCAVAHNNDFAKRLGVFAQGDVGGIGCLHLHVLESYV